MMILKKIAILLLVAMAVVATGCSERDDMGRTVVPPKESVPLKLWPDGFFLDIGEVGTVKILSGNGGYTITRETRTFYHTDRDTGELIREDFTISEEYVKVTLEEDNIRFEQVAIPPYSSGSYIIADSKGQQTEFRMQTLGWVGEF